MFKFTEIERIVELIKELQQHEQDALAMVKQYGLSSCEDSVLVIAKQAVTKLKARSSSTIFDDALHALKIAADRD